MEVLTKRAVHLARLTAFVDAHPDLSLDHVTLRVRSRLAGRDLDGQNFLHLTRYVAGRSYNCLRLASARPDIVLDLEQKQMVTVSLDVPACMADRLAAISDALVIHAKISQQLQVNFHTLGEAVRAASRFLDESSIDELHRLATAANLAKHSGLGNVSLLHAMASNEPVVGLDFVDGHDLVDDGSDHVDIESLRAGKPVDGGVGIITGSRNEADVICVICHGTRLNGFSSCSWCKTGVIEYVPEPSLSADYLMAVQEVNELEVENKVLEKRLAVYQAADAALDLATSHWSTRKNLCMGILEDLSQASGLPVGQLGEMYGVASDVDPHQLTAAAASATAAAVTAGGQLQGIKRKVNSQDVDIDEAAKVNHMAVDRCIEPLSHMKIGKGKSSESSRL